jgi:hypothetical protein
MLSDKEFVHNAEAVEHYGLPFMHAINNRTLPKFAAGGLVESSSRVPSTLADRITAMGLDNIIDVPHLAVGGMPELAAPELSKSLLEEANSNSTAHPIPVDLRTDHGDVRASVDRGGLGQLRKAAVMKNIGKQRQPGWVG